MDTKTIAKVLLLFLQTLAIILITLSNRLQRRTLHRITLLTWTQIISWIMILKIVSWKGITASSTCKPIYIFFPFKKLATNSNMCEIKTIVRTITPWTSIRTAIMGFINLYHLFQAPTIIIIRILTMICNILRSHILIAQIKKSGITSTN